MSRYTIAPQARRDLQSIWDYIGVVNDNPTAANKHFQSLCDRFALLATQPLLGQLRDDLRPGLRTFAAGNYVILYYPMKDGIEVVGVLHGARDIDSMFRAGER
jgi:toxin ParE1/3/4